MKKGLKVVKIKGMNNYRVFRLILGIASILALIAYTEPLIFFLIIFIFLLGWLLVARGLVPFLDNLNHSSDQKLRRETALRKAKMFLAPYKSIWKDLKLSNKKCYLILETDGVSIRGKEKEYPFREFRVLSSKVHNYTDLWNMFCKNFSSYKTYDDLIDDCRLYQLSIYEYASQAKKPVESLKVIALPQKKNIEKLDINNCSEIELTELPGISIVMAKKAIKRRDEIGGFKTIEDFFMFMKLKPHMENQLRELICVKKMKGARKKIERNNERSVDL